MIGAELRQPQLHGPGRVLFPLLVLAQLLVGSRQGQPDRRLDQRPVGEPRGDALVGPGRTWSTVGTLPSVRDGAAAPIMSLIRKSTTSFASVGAAVGLLTREVGPSALLLHLAEQPVGLAACRPLRVQAGLGQPLGARRPTACHVLSAVPTTSAVTTTAAIVSIFRLRRANFHSR